MSSNQWHVYLLKCADDTLYTGITTDLTRRLKQHNGEQAGGAKYTSARRPVDLVWSEEQSDRSAASKREFAIKSLTHSQKKQLART